MGRRGPRDGRRRRDRAVDGQDGPAPGPGCAALLHVPIGITYIQALRRSEGPIERSDWLKTIGVMAGFLALGVATPNITLADKDTPYAFTTRQMGPYDTDAPEEVANKPIAKP